MKIEELDMTTDESLLSSLSEHKVQELKLQPYSLMRQVIASDLCDVGGGGFWYALMDVWICTLSEDQALEAHENIREAKKRAFKWAESHGYNFSNYRPLVDMHNRLQGELKASVSVRIHESLGGNGQQDNEIPNAGGQPA